MIQSAVGRESKLLMALGARSRYRRHEMVNEMTEYLKHKEMWEREQDENANMTAENKYKELRTDLESTKKNLEALNSKNATSNSIIQSLKAIEVARLEREKKQLEKKTQEKEKEFSEEDQPFLAVQKVTF